MEEQIDMAIRKVVAKRGQPPELASKIIAWMKALTSGSEQIDDAQSAQQRVGVLYDAVVVNELED